MLKNIEATEFSLQNWQALQLELEDAESRMRHGGGFPMVDARMNCPPAISLDSNQKMLSRELDSSYHHTL